MTEGHLRVGVIGAGWYAGIALIPQLRGTGRAEIVAISRRNAERLALAQQQLDISEAYTDWREMLAKTELDAVVISTPPTMHAEPTVAALDRGLHVFVEKPMALTRADVERMVTAAAISDRVVMVGYNARNMGSWRTIKRLLEEGAIGTLRQVDASTGMDLRFIWQGMALSEAEQARFDSSEYYSDVFARGNWRSDPQIVGGGMFADVGSHIQDIALWMASGMPAQVMGMAQSPAYPSIISALARLDNGVLFSMTFHDGVSGGEKVTAYNKGRLTFQGDRGRLTADWERIMSSEAAHIWLEQDGAGRKIEPSLPTVAPAEAFVATVLDGAPNPCPPHEAARAVLLTQAVYRSIAEGRMVDV
jgi:predicted dehydrogenase